MSRTDKIEGVIVRVLKNGQQLRELRFPSSLRRAWQEGVSGSDPDLAVR